MTLQLFLEAFTNKDVNITLTEDGDEIITFVSGGTAGIESDVLAKTVKKITLNGSSSLTLAIGV